MRTINDYRKRFYNLMESTIGDVKPLISEQSEYPKPTPTPPPYYTGNDGKTYPMPTPPPVRSNNTALPSGVGTGAGNVPPVPPVHNNTNPTPPMPEPELPSSDKGYLGTALSVHKVASGENLTSIAKTYGVTVDQILKSNPQIKDKNMIKVGEIINIER